jgi:hypothetical protein
VAVFTVAMETVGAKGPQGKVASGQIITTHKAVGSSLPAPIVGVDTKPGFIFPLCPQSLQRLCASSVWCVSRVNGVRVSVCQVRCVCFYVVHAMSFVHGVRCVTSVLCVVFLYVMCGRVKCLCVICVFMKCVCTLGVIFMCVRYWLCIV